MRTHRNLSLTAPNSGAVTRVMRAATASDQDGTYDAGFRRSLTLLLPIYLLLAPLHFKRASFKKGHSVRT